MAVAWAVRYGTHSRWTTETLHSARRCNSSETTEISRRARLARQKCSCPDRSRCPSLTRGPGNSTTALPGATGTEPSPEQLELSERWEAAFALGNEVPEATRLRYETKALLRTEHWLYEGLIAERIQAVRSDSPADGRNR
jgi:hypothetical protein